MKIVSLKPLLFAVLVWSSIGAGQAQVYYDPGFGYNLKDGAFRFNVGAHNVIGDRIGFFYTLEFRKKGPDGSRDNRDIAGGILRVTDRFSVFAGVGLFRKGFFNENPLKGNYRKQIGVDINIPEIRTNVDIGYSTVGGVTLNAGYVFPRIGTGSVYEQWARRNRVRPTNNWRKYNQRFRYRR